MLMMQTKEKIILKVEFNTVLESNLNLKISFSHLLQMHMMLIKGMNTLKVESITALDQSFQT